MAHDYEEMGRLSHISRKRKHGETAYREEQRRRSTVTDGNMKGGYATMKKFKEEMTPKDFSERQSQMGKKQLKIRVIKKCSYCGAIVPVMRKVINRNPKQEHFFCNPEHYHLWRKSKKGE